MRGYAHDDLGEVGYLLLRDARGRPGNAQGRDHLPAMIMDRRGDAAHTGESFFIIDRVPVGARRPQVPLQER